MYEKPLMRGLHNRHMKKVLIRAAGLMIIGGASFIQFFMKPRQKMLNDYYKDFDPVVSCNYMISKGLLRSAPLETDE